MIIKIIKKLSDDGAADMIEKEEEKEKERKKVK